MENELKNFAFKHIEQKLSPTHTAGKIYGQVYELVNKLFTVRV